MYVRRFGYPWSVFDEMEDLHQRFNRLFTEGQRGARTGGNGQPRLNTWVSEDGVVVDVEIPGFDPKDVDVSLSGDELTIRGKRDLEQSENVTYYRREGFYGEFERTVQLPYRAETSKVKASHKNGILRIRIPRMADEKPKRISIKAG